MTDQVQAAVIIPHYNDLERLGKCLRSLAPQATEQPVEVVVADNCSDDDVAALVGQFPWARLVREEAKGAALARNRGVVETSAPTLIFLDADCVPAPDWLTTALSLETSASVVGGRMDVFDETAPPRSGAEAFETVFAFAQRDYIERKGFTVTANMVTSRDVFLTTGPFVNGLSEDLEWSERARAAGYPIRYEDTLVVAHPTRSTGQALCKKWARLTRESYATEVAGHGTLGRVRWMLRAGSVLASSLAHQPRVFRHPGLSLGEKCRASATLVRLRTLRAVWMLGQAAGLGGPA